MIRPRLRFTMLGLMGIVALAALGSWGFREWEKRHGKGAPYWLMARRFEALARSDLKMAREYRDCPREHTPWNVRFQCPGCIPCPATATYGERGKPPTYTPDFTPDSDAGRLLSRKHLEQHEAVAREYEAEAALCRKLSERYARAAERPTGDDLILTREEQQLQWGYGVSQKYQNDSY
jgi:hypothetical protein